MGWLQAGGLLFGDWGTSRLYVLGIAFFFAGRTSFWLILAMSGLTLAVGWAYTQICRIYPDGGVVSTAAKHKSRVLAAIGALSPETAVVVKDAGEALDVRREPPESEADALLAWDSPGLWAIVAVALIGVFNLLWPKHTGGFAIFAAFGMMAITLLITFGALPQVEWSKLPQRIGHLNHRPGEMSLGFVSIVLALSGVEAIANLTGVMKKPVYATPPPTWTSTSAPIAACASARSSSRGPSSRANTPCNNSPNPSILNSAIVPSPRSKGPQETS